MSTPSELLAESLDEQHPPGMKRCPNCYDGGACLPGGCGVDGCTRCGKPCPTCGGSCEVADEPTSVAPAWHDRPDAPGIWVRHLNPWDYQSWVFKDMPIGREADGTRWFGPIPEEP